MAELTPMMQQYLKTKEEYKDCILFYRLGDFYEMFFDDALTVTKELEITLTGKSCGLEERAPMCGVPYHAAEGYLNKLVSRGYKVAICEQVEDPKLAKGLVKREVTRIVTPGTNLCINGDERCNNYLMSIAYFAGKIGLSIADVTTGDYFLTEVDTNKKLIDEIMKYSPKEIICNQAFYVSGLDLYDLKNRLGISIYALEPHFYDEDNCRKCLMKHFKTSTLSGLGIEDFPSGFIAAGSLLQYLYDTQKNGLSHFTHIYPYLTNAYMLLDSSTRRNLELCETLREKQKRGSLLWVLDKTKTAMGGRTLRTWIEQPLINKSEIEKRLDAVTELCKDGVSRDEIREYLNPIYDLERLLGKVSYGSANPRDLIAFRNSLQMLPAIKTVVSGFEKDYLKELAEQIDPLNDLYQLIDASILEEPPIATKEGGIIKDGFHPQVDSLREAKSEGKKDKMEVESLKFYSVFEAAQYHRVTEETIRKAIRENRIKAEGKPYRISESEVKNFVPKGWQRKD